MSVYSKTIHQLGQKNDSLKKQLASEETKIGFLYLDDEACSQETADRYSELKTEFQQLMGTLAEIKSLENKKKDLSADIENVKTELAGLVTKESGLMLTLGIALYGQSGAASVPSFSKAYEEATAFAEKITSLKTQCEQMTESLELQNVFSRVVTKVKINSLSLSITSQQKKLDSALIAGAKSVVEAQDLDESLKSPAYETCVSFKNEWNKTRISLEALQDELQNVEVTLADYGRKSAVQEKADSKNAEIEAFAFQTGHAFDKKYITRDGETLADFPPKYAEGLARVLSLRAELASVNRRLDILQYSEQLEAAGHACEAMNKEVASNEEKISRLQSENAELRQRLTEAAAAMEELRSHRAAVEKEEGIVIEDLVAAGEETAADAKPAEKAAEKAAELVKQAGDGLKKAAGEAEKVAEKAVEKAGKSVKKAAAGAEKAAVKAAESVKKAAGRKTAKKADVHDEAVGGSDIPDDEEAEFLAALNAAKASAAHSDDVE